MKNDEPLYRIRPIVWPKAKPKPDGSFEITARIGFMVYTLIKHPEGLMVVSAHNRLTVETGTLYTDEQTMTGYRRLVADHWRDILLGVLQPVVGPRKKRKKAEPATAEKPPVRKPTLEELAYKRGRGE